MNYKTTAALLTSILIISLVTTSVLAVNADYCCEKTTYGAWCQNAPEEKCDSNYRSAPTSCDATSYCSGGCCYDTDEGLCMENTPQRVCDDVEGSWYPSSECEIPQCELGCCVLDMQAAYVTQARCKKLSGFFGVETDFRLGIGSEVECIAISQSRDEGACVYQNDDYITTCEFTTRENCKSITAVDDKEAVFHKDYLCSADELATNCARTKDTICLEGRDEVYFVDSCGNPANIYDASRAEDPAYWKKIMPKDESCGYGNSNAENDDCGNCDYFLGSICKEADDKQPRYGDKICTDLNCYDTSDGQNHKHGESWCSYDGNVGGGADPVGSVHIRHICVAGEEIIEPCKDYRNTVCIESETNTGSGIFTEAACVANRWQKCTEQEEQEDCENINKGDCQWIEGVSFSRGTEGNTGEQGAIGGLVYGGEGVCVPNYPPGLRFWEEGDAQGICSIASAQCVIQYEEGLFGGEECVENCECEGDAWAEKMNQVCVSLGDCGGYFNWVGEYESDGYEWKFERNDKSLSKGIIDSLRKKAGV